MERKEFVFEGIEYSINPSDLVIDNIKDAATKDVSSCLLRSGDTFFNDDMARASKELDLILMSMGNKQANKKGLL